MVNPKNLGDEQIFKEDFLSVQAVSGNGGTLSSATISNGTMTCTSGGATYEFPGIVAFFEMGGTVRIRAATTNESATAFRIIAMTNPNNSDQSLTFVRRPSDGLVIAQVQQASGNNFYIGVTTQGVDSSTQEYVFVWEPSPPRFDFYIDGSFISSDAGPGGASVTPETSAGKIIVGDTTLSPFVGTVDCFEIYLKAKWNADEVLDAFENDTYPEVDASRSVLWLPGKTWFNNGSNDVTSNIGTAADSLWGDGAGNNRPIIDMLGVKYDGTDSYLDIQSDIIGTSAATFGALIRAESFGEGSIGKIFDNGKVLFYVNDTNDTLTFSSDGTTTVNAATDIIQEGTWQSAIVTRTAAGIINFYVNGELSGTADQNSGTPEGGTTNLIVGNNSGATNTFDGWINEPFIFNYVLTPRQIRWLHEKMLKELNTQ